MKNLIKLTFSIFAVTICLASLKAQAQVAVATKIINCNFVDNFGKKSDASLYFFLNEDAKLQSSYENKTVTYGMHMAEDMYPASFEKTGSDTYKLSTATDGGSYRLEITVRLNKDLLLKNPRAEVATGGNLFPESEGIALKPGTTVSCHLSRQKPEDIKDMLGDKGMIDYLNHF